MITSNKGKILSKYLRQQALTAIVFALMGGAIAAGISVSYFSGYRALISLPMDGDEPLFRRSGDSLHSPQALERFTRATGVADKAEYKLLLQQLVHKSAGPVDFTHVWSNNLMNSNGVGDRQVPIPSHVLVSAVAAEPEAASQLARSAAIFAREVMLRTAYEEQIFDASNTFGDIADSAEALVATARVSIPSIERRIAGLDAVRAKYGDSFNANVGLPKQDQPSDAKGNANQESTSGPSPLGYAIGQELELIDIKERALIAEQNEKIGSILKEFLSNIKDIVASSDNMLTTAARIEQETAKTRAQVEAGSLPSVAVTLKKMVERQDTLHTRFVAFSDTPDVAVVPDRAPLLLVTILGMASGFAVWLIWFRLSSLRRRDQMATT